MQEEVSRYPVATGNHEKELATMGRYGNEMGSSGGWAKRLTAGRRPLVVGVLAAGVVALGGSTALAASGFDRFPPRPLTIGGQGMDMMGAKDTHMTGANGTNMTGANGTNMTGANGTHMTGTKGTHMTGIKGTDLMGAKGH